MTEINCVELSGFRSQKKIEYDTEYDNRLVKCVLFYEVQHNDGRIKTKTIELLFVNEMADRAKEIPLKERVKVTGELKVRKNGREDGIWGYSAYILVDDIQPFHMGTVCNSVQVAGYIRSEVGTKKFSRGIRVSFMMAIPKTTANKKYMETFMYVKTFDVTGNELKKGDEVTVNGYLMMQSVYGKLRTFIKATEINGVKVAGEKKRVVPSANAKSIRIFAIDPGNTLSGYAIFDMPDMHLVEFGKVPNGELEIRMRVRPNYDVTAIEMVSNYGTLVGKTVFETVAQIGRFEQIWEEHGFKPNRIYRHEEKMNLVGKPIAKDKDIKAALVARFAKFDMKSGKGTKAKPDTFYGVSQDVWQAIAVGVTYYDELKAHKR